MVDNSTYNHKSQNGEEKNLNMHTLQQKQVYPLVFLSIAMLFVMVSGTAVAHIILHLFGRWAFTCSSLIFPLSFTINVLVGELYQRKISFTVFLSAMLFSLLFGIVAQDVIPLSVRFVLWGTVGSLIGLSVNTLIVTMHDLSHLRSFTIRYFLSTTVGEFLLVTIVTFGAFTGYLPLAQVVQIWLFSYVTKVLITILLAFPTKILANFIRENYFAKARSYSR